MGAIISQAIKDYKAKDTSYIEMKRLREFFKSKWFGKLSDLNGDYILRKLDDYRRMKGYGIVSSSYRGWYFGDINIDSVNAVDSNRD